MSDPTTDAAVTGGPELHRWVLHLATELGVDLDAVDIDVLLDLARDVAHGIARPAVPITTYLVGHAVAAQGGDRAALERVVERAGAAVERWSSEA